jgi:hypothetical protein
MQTAIDPKEILRLYEALNQRVLAKDSKGTLQIYDELLRLGQPLSEIMAHGLRALNDSPVRGPDDDSDEAFAGRADATVLDEPPPDRPRPEPSQVSIAGSAGGPSDPTIAPDAFGEAPRIAGDTGNRLPIPDLAAPGVRPEPRRAATAPLSPSFRLGLAACAVAVLAGIGVLLMQPGAEKVAPSVPVRDVPVGVRAGTSSAAEGALRATGAARSATVVGAASSTEPGPAPMPAAALTGAALPAAEPAPSIRPVLEAPGREVIAGTPPAVAVPAPKTPPDQQRLADAEIAALLARGDSLVRAGAAIAAPTPEAATPVVAAPTPAVSAPVVATPTPAPPAPKIPPDQPRLAATEVAGLRARGDSLLGVGDIASARLFYERASDAGDGRAALRLGATYDPGFLDRVHLPHLQGDVAQALSWYRRARDLGESEADLWIRALETKSGR